MRAAGLDDRRTPPRFARRRRLHPSKQQGREVVLWVDSFCDAFSPEVPAAAVRVLEDAGFRVTVPAGRACCGLTWISTGQLEGARRRLVRLVDVLSPYAVRGVPIVGLEPSCTAVLRGDLTGLLPDDPRAAPVARATRTLAELLTEAGWQPPDLSGTRVLAQPHCHHHAVMGYDADRALLRAAGAELTTLAGCCGLAGNFGMERGHYEVSVKVAEHALLPALHAAAPGTVLLADGFSCRTQAADLAATEATHLAQLLAAHLTAPTR
jgi:Fe-S oxidoreductase